MDFFLVTSCSSAQEPSLHAWRVLCCIYWLILLGVGAQDSGLRAVVLTTVGDCTLAPLHRAFIKVSQSLVAVCKCGTCGCGLSVGGLWHRSLNPGLCRYHLCDCNTELLALPASEFLLPTIVNHGHLLPPLGFLHGYLRTWWLSTIVRPAGAVSVGHLWHRSLCPG